MAEIEHPMENARQWMRNGWTHDGEMIKKWMRHGHIDGDMMETLCEIHGAWMEHYFLYMEHHGFTSMFGQHLQAIQRFWLVGQYTHPVLKNMTSSIGMMRFPIVMGK